MGKGIDTGTEFFKGLLSKITDPEERAAAERLAKSTVVLTEIGNGVEGQTEINRRMNELAVQAKALETKAAELKQTEDGLENWKGQLTDWRAANDELVAIGQKAKAANWDGKTTSPDLKTAPSGMTEEQVQAKFQELTSNILGYDRDKSELQASHFAKFKELLDVGPLLANPKIREIGLKGVYAEMYKPKIDEFEKAAEKAKEDAIRLDERTKTLASHQQMPYPSVSGVNSGSPLDALEPAKGGGPLVDQATAEYTRLVAARNGASA